jgi:ankyrin repeat protein
MPKKTAHISGSVTVLSLICLSVLPLLIGCAALTMQTRRPFNEKQKRELMSAISRDSPADVQRILDRSGSGNTKSRLDWIVPKAASFGRTKVLSFALAHGADVNRKGKHSYVPLAVAALLGKCDTLRLLLDKGADVNAQDDQGMTPLMIAVKMGRPESLKHCLDKFTSEQKEEMEKSESVKLMLPADLEGYIKTVGLLLDKGADVNEQDAAGETALMLSATSGSPEIVKLLLDKGADVNARSKAGYTALMLFSLVGRPDAVKLLLDKGAVVNAMHHGTLTPLMCAAFLGHWAVAGALVDKGADINAHNSAGQTALIAAILGPGLLKQALAAKTGKGAALDEMRFLLASAPSGSSLETVKLLLERGADPNAKGLGGATPLMYCAMFGRPEVVPPLLKMGADINAQNSAGMTPLMLACMMGPNQAKLFWGDFLGKNSNFCSGKQTPVQVVPSVNPEKCFEVAKLLIEKGADVNARDKTGFTALMWSGQMDRAELVKLLLDKGADVNAKEYKGRPALMQFAMFGRPEVVQPLLDRGADVNVKDKDGLTALMYAAMLGRTKVTKLLLEKGADLRSGNKTGMTALMYAAMSLYCPKVKKLFAGMGIPSGKIITALSYIPPTSAADYFTAAKLLIESGADVNAKDQQGFSALTYAAILGGPGLVRLLLDKGANVNAMDNSGFTVLKRALQRKVSSPETIALLKAHGATE